MICAESIKISRKYSALTQTPPEDVKGECILATAKAMQTWDSEKGAWTTHANWAMTGVKTKLLENMNRPTGNAFHYRGVCTKCGTKARVIVDKLPNSKTFVCNGCGGDHKLPQNQEPISVIEAEDVGTFHMMDAELKLFREARTWEPEEQELFSALVGKKPMPAWNQARSERVLSIIRNKSKEVLA